ncbi:UNVERIFIED_CONTAM: hypothetical protein BEN50_16720 [Euhalothece sp. KZN 001]|uniref:Uncharacterized protein n=2 Tax=Dactylococcopsis salina TaxID=292566 RepID=K9YSU4_DACS8|nr:hypothetical protein Dacsa_0653 [Dactylococcopsis salina PCC 8305]
MQKSRSPMASTTIEKQEFSEDEAIWENLRSAIAASSGFSSWQLENELNPTESQENIDEQVRTYLRETLETLAY